MDKPGRRFCAVSVHVQNLWLLKTLKPNSLKVSYKYAIQMMILFEQFQLFHIFMNVFFWIRSNGQTGWNIFGLLNPQFMLDFVLLQLFA